MDEQQIKETALSLKSMSGMMTISCDEDYTTAAEFLKQIKFNSGTVVDFFKDIKANAYASWKAITAKETQFLEPLKEAETAVKKLMGAYTMEQERIRRVKEEAARKIQEAEYEAQLKKAEELEADGKVEEAQTEYQTATQIVDTAPFIEITQSAVKGVSYSIDYDVTVIDNALVPVSISGIELRPVDLGAVKRLVKAAKGKVEIPGIKITETKQTRVRI